jgi:hypothetical protein
MFGTSTPKNVIARRLGGALGCCAKRGCAGTPEPASHCPCKPLMALAFRQL